MLNDEPTENNKLNIRSNLVKMSSPFRESMKLVLLNQIDLINFPKLNIPKEQFSLENIIKTLQKKERTIKDCQLLMKYLENTDLIEKLKENKMDNMKLMKILYFFTKYVEYEFLERGKYLFKQGDYGNKFFIILKGSINVLIHKETCIRVNGENYLKILSKYFKNGEKDLMDKAIKANKDIFPVFEKDVSRLEEICFIIRLRKFIFMNPSKPEIENFYEEYKSNSIDLKINLDEIMENLSTERKIETSESIVNKRRMSVNMVTSTYTDKTRYRYLENLSETKTIKVYEYEHLLTLTDGKYFGDFSFDDPNLIRTASIQADENTHLCFILSEAYNEFILSEKNKMKIKESKYLIECFFYNVISVSTFQKKHFLNFIFSEKQRFDLLYSDDETVDYIYFIKEGEIELSLNKNMIELHILIKALINKSANKINFDNYDLKNEPLNLLKDLTKKRKLKGFIYGAKETLGLEEKFFGLKRIFEARVYSEKAKIYKIEKSKIDRILDEEKIYNFKYEQSVKLKLDSIIHRLIDIHNLIINFSDNQVSLNNKFNREIIIKENDDSKKLGIIRENRSPNIINQIQIDPQKYVQSLGNMKTKENLGLNDTLKNFKSGDYNSKKANNIFRESIDGFVQKTYIKNSKFLVYKSQEIIKSNSSHSKAITLNNSCKNYITNDVDPQISLFNNPILNYQNDSIIIINPTKLKGSIRLRRRKLKKVKSKDKINDLNDSILLRNSSNNNFEIKTTVLKNESSINPFKNLVYLKKNTKLNKN